MPDILYPHWIGFLKNCLLKSFIHLLPNFKFCFRFCTISKLKLTHQIHIFPSRLYFASFTLFWSSHNAKNTLALNLYWYVLLLHFSTKLLTEWIDFIKLNQAGKYFLNKVYCKVQKEILSLWKNLGKKPLLTFLKIKTQS